MMRILSGAILVILFCFFLSCPAAAGEKGRAYYDFGVFAFEDGDYEGALGNLEKALELNPGYPYYLHYLGKTNLKLGKFAEADKNLSLAYQGDPEISGLIYDMAMLQYQEEDFGRAAELFQTVAEQEPDNVLAYYFAGLSNYKLKEYSLAVEYLLKASEASSNLKTNGYYYIGISQLQLHEFEQATEHLAYVVENAESESLRVNATKWLVAVKKRRKAQNPLSLAARIGRKYDDNVVLEAVGQDTHASEGDWFSMLYVAGKYKLFKQKDFEAGAGFSHYQTSYDNLGEYNLAGSTLQIYARYTMKSYLFDLSYFPSFYWLDSDSYMLRQRINPRVVWQVDNLTSVGMSYAYMINNHFQDTGRIGHSNEVSVEGYRLFPAIDGSANGAVSYQKDSTRHPDKAFEMKGIQGGFSKNIPWNLSLRVGGSIDAKSYRYVDSFYNEKRKDTKYQATVSLSRMFKDDLVEVSGEFSYTKNNSNISDYEYRRKVFSLTVSARY